MQVQLRMGPSLSVSSESSTHFHLCAYINKIIAQSSVCTSIIILCIHTCAHTFLSHEHISIYKSNARFDVGESSQ